MPLPALHQAHPSRCFLGAHGHQEAQEDQEAPRVQLGLDHPDENNNNIKEEWILEKLCF